ncbi:tripartite tricarboxylate transporter permease [Vibrio sp. HN007]|uniref:tripartite tricarboxylate transporter permease n=1 Tax=Vibrio iocasae TaxID=3098914 RepID=UPI0035D4667F
MDIAFLYNGLTLLADPLLILLLIAGMIVGLFLGALPGITTSLSLTLLLPFAVELPVHHGFMLMLAVYTSTIIGAGVMSILFNVPGNPGAIATAFDGYPMTCKGQGQEALSAHVMASATGNTFGWLVVAFMFIPLSQIAKNMGNVDVLLLTVLVVVLVGVMGANMYGTPQFCK